MIGDLVKLGRFTWKEKVTRLEKISLEVFIVAFATMSCVAEIAALNIDHVSRDGNFISIRTKTNAKSNVRHVKRVADGCGLTPVKILVRRREQAILEGRRLLFVKDLEYDEEITSAQISGALGRLAMKAKIRRKISAHSARKGAAISALLSGLPVVAIQSFGVWRNVDCLQAYLGRIIRENFGILSLIENRELEVFRYGANCY